MAAEEVREECGTGFYRDVHRVRRLLASQEKAWLRSLSPDLDAVIRSWRKVAPAALPDYPALGRKFEGKKCLVHYTLAGNHAIPDVDYADSVASYIDEAIENQTKAGHFRPATRKGAGSCMSICSK